MANRRFLDKLIEGADGFYREVGASKEEKKAKLLGFQAKLGAKKGSWHPGDPVGYAWERLRMGDS